MSKVQVVRRQEPTAQPTQRARAASASVADRALDARPQVRSQAALQRALDGSARVEGQAALAAQLEQSGPARQGPVAARDAARGRSGLPAGLAAAVERLSGVSLAGVRVHYGSAAPAQLQAHAFTRGSEIHVAPGQETHLPHEAWHVVQQAQGRVRPTLHAGDVPVNDDPRLEREADEMGARARSAASVASAPPPEAPAVPARPPAGAPVQGVWATVQGEDRKSNLRTVFLKGGRTVYRRSSDGRLFVRASGSADDGTLIVRSKGGRARAEALGRLARQGPSGVDKERRRAATQRIRQVKRQAQRQRRRRDVDVRPRFETLDALQQEQVLALGRNIAQHAAALFENDLADYLHRTQGAKYRQIAQALGRRRETRTATEVSRREQSYEFELDIESANKLFGGSIDKTDKNAVIGGLAEEQTFDDSGELRPESLYAESARGARNRAVSGLDSRVAPVLEGIDVDQRRDALWIAFAVLHREQGTSLFEAFASAPGLGFDVTQGLRVYRHVPSGDLPSLGWSVYPDSFEGPAFLDYLARALHDLFAPSWPGVTVPDALKELVATRVSDLKAATGVAQADDSGGQVPRALWDEVPADERRAIAAVSDEQAYLELKQRYADEGRPAAYIALVLRRGAEFGDPAADWHLRLARALVAPEARGATLDAPQVSRQSQRTLGRNIADVAEFLGDYDYGTSLADKQESAQSLFERDPRGAYAVSKYITGGFGTASDTLDAPWSQENQQGPLTSIHGAVRGLEGLPVREGWSYRREESANEHVPGEIISPGVLWSSALAPVFASQFDRKGEGTLYVIHSRYTGRDVQLLAGRLKWYQREVLFPPYARFAVEDKRQDERYGTVYTLRELPPQGRSLELGAVLDERAGHGGDETRELRTLIDARHWDKALDKYRRQEAWTGEEAEQAHIEGLTAGIHHPRELYGLETFRRWRDLLRWRPTQEEHERLWTVDGFLEVAARVSGAPEQLRDEWAGWGADEDEYELAPTQADNAAALGLRVGRRHGAADLTRSWKTNLRNLPRRQYRDGRFNLVDRDTWIAAFKGDTWAWRGDVAALVAAGVLRGDRKQKYFVTYGLGTRVDVAGALQRVLQGARQHLGNLDRGAGNYAEKVTQAAAELQQRIVAIHPLDNANGRVSRLYMYKVLQAYLPDDPRYERLPVIPDTGKDLTTSSAEWQGQLWDLVKPGHA